MFSRCASLSGSSLLRHSFSTLRTPAFYSTYSTNAASRNMMTKMSQQSSASYRSSAYGNIDASELLQRARYLSSGGGGRQKAAQKAANQSTGSGLGGASKPNSSNTTFLQRWMAPKEMPPRWTLRWYGEMVLICTVFAITGSSTMVLVRPAVSDVLGLKGSFKEGPWSYRICSLVIMTPLYASLLVVVGTVFGRHAYFRFFAVKMFSRFGIPPELMDETFHQTKKTFRKY